MKKRILRYKKYMVLYLMMIPGLLYLIINNYIPMAGIVIAFKRYNYQKGMWRSPWVGFDNFRFLFATRDSLIIVRNTLLYNTAFILISVLVGIVLAILLDQLRSRRLKRGYQMLFLMPYMISMVVVSYIVYAFLSTNTGFLNRRILELFGKDPISWYSEAAYWPFILVLVNQWKWLGYNTVIYYSSIIGIDTQYYEAAIIDGASRWQRIIHITLPMVKKTIIIMVLMQIGNIFRSDFGLFYQVPMNSSSLMNVTNTIDTYVYRGLKSMSSFGMTSAAGVYQSIVGFVTVFAANLVVRKLDKDSALF